MFGLMLYCYLGSLPTCTQGGNYLLYFLSEYGVSFSILFVVAVGFGALPGGCSLLVDPASVELLRADANGSFTEAFTLPAKMNFTVTFQYLPFELVGNSIKARATNAWELTCSGF